jgi:transaldolase
LNACPLILPLRFVNQLSAEESMTARKTKMMLDGGDAQETRRIQKRLGFLDGQTTNPSLRNRTNVDH